MNLRMCLVEENTKKMQITMKNNKMERNNQNFSTQFKE